jgi:hypothetical protein
VNRAFLPQKDKLWAIGGILQDIKQLLLELRQTVF